MKINLYNKLIDQFNDHLIEPEKVRKIYKIKGFG